MCDCALIEIKKVINMNHFITPAKIQVAYTSIIEALIDKTKENWVHRGPARNPPHTDVREYRTVGFYVGRQCGKTDALVDYALQHGIDDVLIICKDRAIEKEIGEKFVKRTHAISPRHYMNTGILNQIIKDRQVETYKENVYARNEDGTLKISVGENGALYPVVMHNKGDVIRNTDDLWGKYINTPPSTIKYILVDDASFSLNYQGVTDHTFNRWVGETFNEDTIVVRIG